MSKKATLVALIAVAATAVFAGGASATAPLTEPFGTGDWTPGAGNESQFALVTSSDGTGSFGGASLVNFPSDPEDVDTLSFDFKADTTGASGGSPRLVVAFSDGSFPHLRPLALTSDWSTVDGMSGANWDDQGGTCGSQFAVTWEAIKTCHAGESITGMWVVNDSGWLYPDGLAVFVDNITVNELVAGGPGNAK
jgi:hypothetical protein